MFKEYNMHDKWCEGVSHMTTMDDVNWTESCNVNFYFKLRALFCTSTFTSKFLISYLNA